VRRFYYVLEFLRKIKPGIQLGNYVDHPTSLGPSSYGSDVVFDWQPSPLAQEYVLKIGRWPWNQLAAVDPPNCTFPPPPNQPLPYINQCNDGSTLKTFEGPATPGMTISGALAGKGRNCWVVWPKITDPKAPGTVSARQPFVEIFPRFCYTSGPAKPEIVIDGSPPACDTGPTPFPQGKITGKITFPYVPDAQLAVDVSPFADFTFDTTKCHPEPNWFEFPDLYDCVVQFAITPHEQTMYTVNARTWASDQHPPVMNDASRVHNETQCFKTGACGAIGEACCAGNACDAGAVCQSGKCVACGANAQPCCAGNGCNVANAKDPLVCNNGTCTGCGQSGVACCPSDPNFVGGECRRASNANCTGGKCVNCGSVGQDCCTSFTPPACASQPDVASCVNGKCLACGHIGQPCCAATLPGGHQQGCVAFASCNSALRCQSCGRAGENCCFTPDAPCADGACSNGTCPGTPSGGLSFTTVPVYAPFMSPFFAGLPMTVEVCNHGSTAQAAFVQAVINVRPLSGADFSCIKWGLPSPDQVDNFDVGGCKGENIGAGRPVFTPNIAAGACQEYTFFTFIDGNGQYDWLISINGSSSGTLRTVHECNDPASGVCFRTM
jgi:hypothetical protein